MPALTDLASAEVKRHVKKLYGKTLTRFAQVVTDGLNTVWACDVMVTPTDPTGRINQYINEKNGKSTFLTGLPGQKPEDWQLDDSLPGHVDTTLRNVPIAKNNKDLIYADVGAPVIVERSDAGSGWQVIGFAQEMPGTHKMYPVDLGEMTIDTVIDLSVTTRLLTLAELGESYPDEYPFGSLPFGASAIYEGGVLARIV